MGGGTIKYYLNIIILLQTIIFCPHFASKQQRNLAPLSSQAKWEAALGDPLCPVPTAGQPTADMSTRKGCAAREPAGGRDMGKGSILV